MKHLTRRSFLQASVAASAGACLAQRITCGKSPKASVTVAAVQYHPTVGDVDVNLKRAEKLILDAISEGARWIVLPEFFTSGLAMDPRVFNAHRPVDGTPTQFLKHFARKHTAYVGGSFLAKSGGDIFNTFVLATPSGATMTHDKDFPSTIFESSLYAGGEDAEYVKTLENHGASTLNQVIAPRKSNHVDGVFATNGLSVGAALCWELARYRTARRLHGKIDLLLGASAWWWSTPRYGWPDERNNDEIAKDRTEQIALIREAPRRLARMLGVPVVHANFVGDNPGFFTSDFANPVTGQYLGQSQIVNSNGETVALLQDQEGVAIGEVKPGRSEAKAKIPRDFWMPEMDARARRIWVNSGAAGRDFYVTQRRPKLRESR